MDAAKLPEWFSSLTIGEIMVFRAGVGTLFLIIKKIWRPLRRIIKALEQIAADWNGTAERKDGAGIIIEAGRPGVMAQLETLRAQVQNSHRTNLRDDVDKVRDLVGELTMKFGEHGEIARLSDESQGRVEEQLLKFTPMLEDLHAKYVSDRDAKLDPEKGSAS
jgi:hypothetical protein